MRVRSESRKARNINANRVTVPNLKELSWDRRTSAMMAESIPDSGDTDDVSVDGDVDLYVGEGESIPTTYLPTC